jgi:hypothetical protein
VAEIDGVIGAAGYAAFALQQPLPLDRLADAAEHAALPLASQEAVDIELIGQADAARPYEPSVSPERIEQLLAGAPELSNVDPEHDRRRITDPPH